MEHYGNDNSAHAGHATPGWPKTSMISRRTAFLVRTTRQPSESHGSRDEIPYDIGMDKVIGRHGDRARRQEQRRHARGEQGTEGEATKDEQAQAFGQGEEEQEGEEARRQAKGLARQLVPMACSSAT